ncbi:hypothetical protein [Aliidiomarina quisquiliarum]|uniref:hypothetical protein n=1 Tax=Aliidiomarina quisquiliarum TaxID=2938947 RepID=UPI00208E5CEC|nr:hypothetical protein [Aliidiomarina quisquiliarum]MCO4319963.1 hypothetical protein [Aliidiomarina quisquiliarum]
MHIPSYEERLKRVSDRASLIKELHEAQIAELRAKKAIYQGVPAQFRGLPVNVAGNFNPHGKRVYRQAHEVVRKLTINFNRLCASMKKGLSVS